MSLPGAFGITFPRGKKGRLFVIRGNIYHNIRRFRWKVFSQTGKEKGSSAGWGKKREKGGRKLRSTSQLILLNTSTFLQVENLICGTVRTLSRLIRSVFLSTFLFHD